MGRGAAPLQTSPQILNNFKRLRSNKRFVHGEESTRGSGHEEPLLLKKPSMVFLVAWATLSSALNPVFRRSPRSRTALTV